MMTSSLRGVKVSLCDDALWETFWREGTEMVITKQGR